jgi:hypothetical protein
MAKQDDGGRFRKASPEDVAALTETLAKLKRKLDDQTERIEALARGREQGMVTVSQLRDELALVAADRDQLRRKLTELEAMQTETLAFDDSGSDEATGAHGRMPSIDDLMATFSGFSGALGHSHSTMPVDNDPPEGSGEYQEMISPDQILLGPRGEKTKSPAERYLLHIEPGNTTKCLLDQDLLTIGRSDSADIKIDGDYISRIHCRILRIGMDSVIEDADSRNGTRVNGELIERHVLKHGDLVRVGTANFRFVDPSSGESDGE